MAAGGAMATGALITTGQDLRRGVGIIVGRLLLLSVLVAMLWPTMAAASDEPATQAGGDDEQRYVWWEAESPAASNFPPTSWFAPSTFADTKHLLSGEDWLSASGNRGKDELFARYRIEVPADAKYQLWTRKFWKHGPFRWRFNKADWQTCGRDCALADSTYLREHLGANWVHLGEVDLKAGDHDFEIRLLAAEGESATAAFDAFLLVRGPFMPRGKLRPDERSGQADEGFFAWEPMADSFADSALLDLRKLNETEAGQSGRVRRQGDKLLLGDGRPARFWAVNVGPGIVAQSPEAIDYMARRLAKAGVNMVRYHGPLFAAGADRSQVDQQRLGQIQFLVAALKRQGIYTTISFYFPLWFEPTAADGITGFDPEGGRKSFAIIYFDPRMQQIHRSWISQLLTAPNPHTGLPLAQDPAVAMVEAVNEDSLFFHTFARKTVPPEQWQRLEKMFAAWAAKEYGSVEKALAAWGGAAKGDDPAAMRLELADAWFMTRDGLKQARTDGRRQRIGDQMQFLANLQHTFYSEFANWLREDLKYGGLVVAGNWHTADRHLLDPIERWTYTAGDVIDCHRYFGGRHDGTGSGYSVRVGHTWADRSALDDPASHPLTVRQAAGYPQIISELGWPNPNRFRGESTFVSAATAAVQGIDGLYFFAIGNSYLADTGMSKFAVSSPAVFGAFPATALMYRRGDIDVSPVAVREKIDLSRLWALDAAIVERPAVDPRAFIAGPVLYDFGSHNNKDEDAAATEAAAPQDWRRAIENNNVTSLNGQVRWNSDQGFMTINTPRAQGACGKVSAGGDIKLADATITMANDFAQVLLISLDDEPLVASRRVLVQAMTREQPYGFRAEDNRITALGGWPMGVRQIRGNITLRTDRGKPTAVQALDENGYPRPQAVIWNYDPETSRITLTLPQDSAYTTIQW